MPPDNRTNPMRFICHDLAFVGTWPGRTDDLLMKVAGKAAARLIKNSGGAAGERWDWHFTGPQLPPELQPGNGSCATLAEAKEQVADKWREWLAWALMQKGLVSWSGLDSREPV